MGAQNWAAKHQLPCVTCGTCKLRKDRPIQIFVADSRTLGCSRLVVLPGLSRHVGMEWNSDLIFAALFPLPFPSVFHGQMSSSITLGPVGL